MDPDHELLLAVERAVHNDGPAALDPAALLAEEMVQDIAAARPRFAKRSRLMKIKFSGVLAILLFHTSAMAQDRVEIGTLECRGSTTSFVVGSVTDLSCGYRPAGGGPVEPYRATMRRAGVDIGFNQQIVVVWGVWAPSRGSAPLGSQRQLRRCASERHGRRRRRRQRADRRLR